ncbi:hypothetical protein [Caminibacter pacificus]|uniref:Uncharacterized protein n=1 Tax=Caminibacter pacificus TaxID=1424653 RepID=A0AAJ4UX03_9BACT|nr:hypothetical protein [Caminibacter pacificus]QDD68154.1 hypothetical protein C6V80_09885 [Caminibacter pacificus]ROR38772.1 hypothetical protein EDC58_1987 [Caminibacter pacificus]
MVSFLKEKFSQSYNKAIMLLIIFGLPAVAQAEDYTANATDKGFVANIIGILMFLLKGILALFILGLALAWLILPIGLMYGVKKHYEKKEDTDTRDISKEKMIAYVVAAIGGVIGGLFFAGLIGQMIFDKNSIKAGLAALLGKVYANAVSIAAQ